MSAAPTVPETRYVKTPDGVSLACQIIGEGPVDIALLPGWCGDVEIMWEYRPLADLLYGLASFSRLILHDRRGTGLSDRGAIPNLETRAADLGTVLDAARSDRTALLGIEAGGAVAALFAATRPARAQAFVWYGPLGRATRAPDYPYGSTLEDQVSWLAIVAKSWGTESFGAHFVASDEPTLTGDRELMRFLSRMSRHLVTPALAVEMQQMWYATDVRSVLGAVRIPTMTVGRAGWPTLDLDEFRHVSSLIPWARSTLLPGSEAFWFTGDTAPFREAIRDFLGVPARDPALDTVLSTVLFTDIVGSTQKQAQLGDHRWKELVGRHHAIVREALAKWHGAENDTAGDGFYATFDGPARAIRCALEITERVRALSIEIRAGLHTGECEVIEGKCAGLAVSIGARVAAVAEPSQVLVSQTVKDLVAGSGFTFVDVGEHYLRGVPERWRLYRVTA